MIKDKREPEITIYSEAPITYFGGGERVMVELGNYLTSLGYSLELVSDANAKLEKRISEKELYKIAKFPFRTINFMRFSIFRSLYQPLPPLSEVTLDNRVSIIFVRRIPPKKYLENISRSHTKVIFALHGMSLEVFRIAPIKIIIHQIITRFQLSRLSNYTNGDIMVQTLTQRVESYLIRNGTSINHVTVIGNGISSNKYSVGRNDNCFNIIFIGRIEDLQKGIKRLIKVCELIKKVAPQINVLIIGSGKDNRLLHKISTNAKVFQNAQDSEKIELLRNSNLLIITSNIEPFSIVAVEAIACGLPIVSTPASGPVEIISKGVEFGTISSFSVKDIVQDICSYYNKWQLDKDQYFEMKKKISQYGKKLFDVSNMDYAYKEVIDTMLNKP